MIIKLKNKKISQETINDLILITKNVLPWINDYNNINISMETKTTGVISDPENSSIEPTNIKLKLSGNDLDDITYTKKKLNHTWTCTPINEALILNSNTINDNDIINENQIPFDTILNDLCLTDTDFTNLLIGENNINSDTSSINLFNKDNLQSININPDDNNIVLDISELNAIFGIYLFNIIEDSIIYKLKQLNTNKLILQLNDDIYAVAIDENNVVKFQTLYGWVDISLLSPSTIMEITSEILQTKRT
jgi:hypothetical protein